MNLTKEQKRNLALYASYQNTAPSFWRLLRANLWRYFLFAILVILIYLLSGPAGIESISLIAAGLFFGVLIRDIGTFLRFIRVWPATAEVIDWQRLESLLAES